jgi:hypothetical protein
MPWKILCNRGGSGSGFVCLVVNLLHGWQFLPGIITATEAVNVRSGTIDLSCHQLCGIDIQTRVLKLTPKTRHSSKKLTAWYGMK